MLNYYSKSVLGADSFIGSTFSGSFIDATQYGIWPDTQEDISDKLEAVLIQGRLQQKPVKFLPGKYVYKRLINNAGGGIVCTDGYAWFDSQDPTYTNTRIDFQTGDGVTYQDGLHFQGIQFTCSTRPDSGLTNDSGETNAFIRIIRAKNVKIWDCKFKHNRGGAALLRDVYDGTIIGCEAEDVFKDAFHITDNSFNIVRAYNVVRGGGDDAFPVVGYTSKGVMPYGITDIGNRVYGVRYGRAFAYVGCKDIKNIGCFVDGRLPSNIPQQSTATIAKYNSPCALYIAAEAGGFNTYGCENIEVSGFTAEWLGPSIDTSGTPVTGIGTYQAIHIAASNGTGNPIKNVKINATIRNTTSRALFVVGNGATENIEADISMDDNTDPGGFLSLTGTPGSGNQPAAEFQNTRNIKLKLRGNKIAKGAVWVDANCSGYADIDVSVGSVCQTTSGFSVITIVSGSKLDVADFKLNFETSPTASGIGSINRLIDNPNYGIVRSVRVTGVDHSPASTNALNGWPMRSITLQASPSTVVNYTGRPMVFFVRAGTVSAISRTMVRGRSVANAVTTGASGTVQITGDFTDIYTASAVVTFFNSRGVAFATGTVASSSLSGGVTTVTFDATGVNASFGVGMQMAVVGTMKVIQGRTNGVIELPPETAVQVTYSSIPTCAIGDMSY